MGGTEQRAKVHGLAWHHGAFSRPDARTRYSIGKLEAGTTLQEISSFALEIQRRMGATAGPQEGIDAGRFQALLLRSSPMRLEGGTDEIFGNIVVERVLGLPPDIRVDKDVPFDRKPTRPR